VIRPGDANEAAVAWELAIAKQDGPVVLALTRQNLTTFDRAGKGLGAADDLAKGGYVLKKEEGAAAQVLLVATGSEVELALNAAEALEKEGVDARVVSMPSLELFRAQSKEYRDSVLPPAVRKRVVIEAGVRMGWEGIATEDGDFVTQDRFGASAPAKELAKKFGFTVENVVAKAKGLLK
jgi:transketolase